MGGGRTFLSVLLTFLLIQYCGDDKVTWLSFSVISTSFQLIPIVFDYHHWNIEYMILEHLHAHMDTLHRLSVALLLV